MLASEAETERAVDVLEGGLASLEGKVEGELKVPSGAKVRVSLPTAPKTPRSAPVGAEDAVELKVTLVGTKVWRLILTPAGASLAELHAFLQEVMGGGNRG